MADYRLICLLTLIFKLWSAGSLPIPNVQTNHNVDDPEAWFDAVKTRWTKQTQAAKRVSPSFNEKHQPRTRLNVLLVIIDDMRADLAVYGHEDAPPTPNIDKFADSARVFRRAYAQFPDCAPSRSSFLTGLRPDRLGIDSHECTTKTPDPSYKCNFRESLPGTVSMPQYFKEAGYISLSYGKVFHQGLDDDQSWSSQEEFPDGYTRGRQTTFRTKKWRYEQWFDPLNRGCGPRNHTSNCFTEEHSSEVPIERYVDHRTTTFAIKSITKLRSESKPWFMAVGLVRPHLPFVCPGTFWDINHDPYVRSKDIIFKQKVMEGTSYVNEIAQRDHKNHAPKISKHLGQRASKATQLMKLVPDYGFGEFRDFLPWDIRDIVDFANAETYVDRGVTHSVEQLKSDTRRGYRSCISFVDYEFGRITSALSESGQENNTVVALMSDHGFKLGEFDMWGKHSTLHMDVHVPLLIRHPNMKLPGKQEHQVVELVDVFPTLADLSGVSAKRVLDGQSLALVVFDPLHAPPLTKPIAVSQFLPFVKHRRCMSYVLIGRYYMLKKWAQCSHVPQCPGFMDQSVDLHAIPLGLKQSAVVIPFSLEKATNLMTLKNNSSLKLQLGMILDMKKDFQLPSLSSASSSSSSLSTATATIVAVFPPHIAAEVKAVMTMIISWSKREGMKYLDSFVSQNNQKEQVLTQGKKNQHKILKFVGGGGSSVRIHHEKVHANGTS